jgi:hypothetical protein
MVLRTTEDDDTQLNPGETDYNDKFNQTASDLNDVEKNGDAYARADKNNANDIDPGKLEDSVDPPGDWDDKTEKQSPKKEKKNFFARMSRNQRLLAGGGISLGAIIPLIIVSLLPLKLEMMVQNVAGQAAAVPQHAVEQRVQYLVTRALAARLLSATNNSIDGKLVFCKNAGVACSLFATYSNDYFEKKLGITIDAKANGQFKLGGKASTWDITLGPDETKFVTSANGEITLEKVANKITVNSNNEMKKIIHTEVWEKGKNSSYLTKFLTKKLLMKKYGVTAFRGPAKVEQALDSLKTAKSNVKTLVLKNTVGKIAPRLTTYLACLQGDIKTCQNLRESLSSNTTSTPVDPDNDPKKPNPDTSSEEYKKAKAAYDVAKNASGTVGADVTESALKKIISSNVLKAAGGAGAAIGITDLVMNAVNSLNSGALENIWYDMSTQTYAGFASVIDITAQKMISGDLDADTISAATSLFDNAESSPLYSASTGQVVDTSQGITVACNGTDGNKVNTKLAPGELVCSDQKVVRDYTSTFRNTPGWQTLATAADLWVKTIGGVVKAANGVMSDLIGLIPGFQQLMSLISPSIDGFIQWVMGLFFDPPSTGSSASGSDNYLAFLSGKYVQENATMEEGVDSNGTAMGGGGTVLSSSQVAVISNDQTKMNQDYYNSQPLLARVFDTNLIGSFAQQVVSRIPTSVSSIAKLPLSSFTGIFNTASAQAVNINLAASIGMPQYGYASNDPALTADPSTYNTDSCAVSAQARLDSLKPDPTHANVAVYTVADPCALEKMVVGVQLASNGVIDDPNSLQEVTGQSATTSSTVAAPSTTVRPPNTKNYGQGWTLNDNIDYTSYACDPRTKDVGTYKSPTFGFSFRLCQVISFPSSSGGDINQSGSNVVNALISTNVVNMFEAAKTDGINFGISDGTRSVSNPSYSPYQHAKGLAVDIGSPVGGKTICYVSGSDGRGALSLSNAASCRQRTDNAGNAVRWLDAHAATYGFQNLKSEPWHWSTGES